MSDRLADLEALLDHLPAAVDRRRLGDRLTRSLDRIRNVPHNADRLAAAMELAQATGYSEVAQQAELLDEVRDEAFSVGEKLEEACSDETLRDAVDDYEAFLKSLSNLDRGLRLHWSVVAGQRYRPLISLGMLLQRTLVAPELGERLAACGQRAAAGGEATLRDLLAKAKSVAAEHETLQSESGGLFSGGEIGAFIEAVADQRATLSHITPAVLAWLTEKNALDRFSLAPRG
jgi:hypothetical protein